MSDEMFIEGKSYLSSKRAAQISGYAQDYIGQLSRKGLIDAQRIGGLWYVSMESLDGYKEKNTAFKPEPPAPKVLKTDPSTLVFFDGKEYISASRAAEITNYVQDYVGQLARSGQILARQVGNRWYVEKESLLRHKQEKDGLLAAVQVQAVGLQHPHETMNQEALTAEPEKIEAPLYTYAHDTSDLMPVIKTSESRTEYKISHKSDESHATPVPIHKRASDKIGSTSASKVNKNKSRLTSVVSPQRVQVYPLVIGAAATIVIVLSVGYASVLKKNSVYAAIPVHLSSPQSLAAGVGEVFNKMGDMLEPLLTRDLSYRRNETQ
ncbi:MAG TPA: helix-turn-helix domain-containing protein [Candidatus Paceibacterota bacterium]|nr:helix-turn-helix domain-containing protein [Candidatus Paceibacterota bacterium]